MPQGRPTTSTAGGPGSAVRRGSARRGARWSWVAGALVVWAGLVHGLSAQPEAAVRDGAVIKEIRILGNRQVSDTTIKSRMRTQEGSPFNSALLSKDIKMLSGPDGYFIHVDVDHKVLPDGQLILLFRVKEMNFVERVRCVGVAEEKPRDVLAEVRIEPGRFINQNDIDLKVRRLEAWYRKKGYEHVQVKAVTRPGRSGGTEVIFSVDEGPKVRVHRIVFRGSRTLSDGDLRDRMHTERSGFFGKGDFNREVLEADCVRLQEYYRVRGFKDAIVSLLDLNYSDDFSEVTAVIGVDEGEAYLVEGIEIEGNKLFTTEELLALMEQRVGERYDGLRVQRDLLTIERVYQEQAYLDVTFLDPTGPRLVYALDAPRVKLIYRIQEGEKIRLGQIKLEGNQITQDKVILRELTVAPGDYADIGEVERSIQRLVDLGYFEHEGGVSGPIWQETGSPNVKDLLLKFREGRTGHLRMAVGIGSDSGLSGIFSVVKENFDIADLPDSVGSVLDGGAFSGGGQTLVLTASPGTRINNYQIRFIEPRVFNTPWQFDVSLYQHQRRFDTYRSERTGARLMVGRRLDRDLGLKDIFQTQTAFRFEVIRLEDSEDDIDVTVPPVKLREERTLRINSLEQRFHFMSWDDRMLTTRGWEASVSVRPAGGILGGTEDFWKVLTMGEVGIPLYTTENRLIHVLGFRGRFGWAEEYGRSDFVPLVERFFLGGNDTLRGFDFQGVGPRDRNGEVTGGQAMWATSVEYRFPLFKRVLRGVLFWDAGALAERITDDEFDKVRMSLGFGFRITIPFLGRRPFAIDFGFPVMKEPDDERRLISFSIGRELF